MPSKNVCSVIVVRNSVLRAMALCLIFSYAAVPFAHAEKQSSGSAHLLPPGRIACAGRTNPLSVAETNPVFSWGLNAASPNLHSVAQTAYRVQVADADAGFGSGKPVLWDSGVVKSNSTLGVVYSGPALVAQRAYEWRVRVWDERGSPTDWSSVAHWTQAPEWHAQWIADAAESENGPLPLFRKGFRVTSPVKRALLYVSGLGQDEVRINGRKVGEDEITPGWSDYRKSVFYDAYDVTALLRPGENAVGVMLGNGMYRVIKTPGRYTKFAGSFGQLKCIVQLHIDFTGDDSVEVRSDGSWKAASGPITFSSTYGGEDFDARREPTGWDQPGFDDSSWHAATVVDGPGGRLMPEIAPPVRVMHTYAPVTITHPKPSIEVYDLGQNFAGWPEIKVTGPAGSTVKLIPGELLNPDGTVSQRSSGGPQWFAYTLRGSGIEPWRPRFSYYGFRYLQVEGAADQSSRAENEARIVSLRGQAVHTSSATAGDFSTSDDLLNRIHTLILRAIENNAVSLFTDCPHREKLGWLEESHLMAPSILYDFDAAGLFAATARNIADAQKTEGKDAGMVPEIAPQYVVFKVDNGAFDDSPEWGSTAVLAPWYVFERTGDLSLLASQYDVMRGYVAYLGTRAQDGIISYGLGDWYDIGPGDPGFSKLTTAGVTATAIYFQDLSVMRKVAALLGKKEESEEYGRIADAERTAFNQHFFDTKLHRYDKGSQTAQAMPLAIGLVPDGERAAVLKALVDDIQAHQNHVTAGDIGYHYVVDALMGGGRSDVLLDMLERTDVPSYGAQLAHGATALTEAWDSNPTSSQDHFMLGHAEEWFYRGLGGINVDLSREGAERLVLRPAVSGKLERVKTDYRSSLGMVESSWRRMDTGVLYDFTIPPNTTATIVIRTSSPRSMVVNGAQVERARGVVSSAVEGDLVRIVVGSGSYKVHASGPAAQE